VGGEVFFRESGFYQNAQMQQRGLCFLSLGLVPLSLKLQTMHYLSLYKMTPFSPLAFQQEERISGTPLEEALQVQGDHVGLTVIRLLAHVVTGLADGSEHKAGTVC